MEEQKIKNKKTENMTNIFKDLSIGEQSDEKMEIEQITEN